MTANSVDVRSLERLQRFHAALAAFIRRFSGHISTLDAQYSRAYNYIERRHTALSSRVGDLEQILYEADEDSDISHLEEQLEEARSLLEETLECEVRVNAALARHQQQLARIHSLLRSGIPRGRTVLQRKIDALHDILGVIVHDVPVPGASIGQTSAAPTASSPGDSLSPDRGLVVAPRPYSAIMRFYPLPQGFRWIQLDEVAPLELAHARTIAESGKESFANMRKGFAILQQEILPALAKMTPDKAQECFREQDVSAPRSDGLFRQNVFSAFFGQRAPEVIRLEKRRSDDFYSVINGYHRLHVAIELGWEAIPANAVEVD
ncbi:MAG TPA: hypothetical protein VNW97_23385 [Candidatus Saccharimonadales bacterium]|jgi:hypothetical protein|nr:hypothetical protein [Candidatus Saccharimonadales bacterium]